MGLRLGTTKIRNVTTTDLDNRPLVTYNEWQRPSEWIDLPTIASDEEIFVGLFAVDSTNHNNYLALMANGNYIVDWGDGTIEHIDTGIESSHIYNFSAIDSDTEYVTAEGFTYRQVLVKVYPQDGSSLTAINLQRRHPTVAIKNNQVYDVAWLEIIINAPNLTNGGAIGGGTVALSYCKHLKITGLTSVLTNLSNLCSGMQSLEKFEIEGDTSNVSNFSNMFNSCYELEYIPDFDMSRSAGANTSGMFYYCFRLTRLPSTLSDLISTITTSMFYNCRSLRSIPKFNVSSSCTNMYTTFSGCEALKTVPHIDTSNAIAIYGFLQNCFSLERCPLFDTSNATTMQSFFNGCRSLKAVPSLNTSKNTNFLNFYANCTTLKSIPQTDTSSGTSFNGMFSSCSQLESVPYIDTSLGTDFTGMFNGCYSLRTVPLLDLSGCRSLYRMFYNCYNLQDLPNIDTASMITNGVLNNNTWRETFTNCYSLKRIPSSFLNGIQVGVDFSNIFQNCYQLRTLPSSFSNFNTNTNVFSVVNMFSSCFSLKELPSVMDLSTITSAANQNALFNSCRSLEKARITGCKYNITYYNCFLGRDEIVEIFNGLATVSSGTIDIRNNPGNADITEDDKAIAENKGWTISIN